MKRLIRNYAIDTYSLYITTTIAHGLIFENGYRTLLLAGAALMGVSLLAKPIINLLLLPLNMVTFGLFRWVSSAIVIYLVTLIVPGFKLVEFAFGGYTSKWIDLPAMHLSGFWAYVAFSFILSILTSTIYWIIK